MWLFWIICHDSKIPIKSVCPDWYHIITLSVYSPWIGLCGNTATFLRQLSSFTYTSSAVHVISVILTQLPIVFFQPIILLVIRVYGFTVVCPRIVESLILTPSPMLQFAPTTTFGPSYADGWTVAVLWTITPHPLWPSAVMPLFFACSASMYIYWPIR